MHEAQNFQLPCNKSIQIFRVASVLWAHRVCILGTISSWTGYFQFSPLLAWIQIKMTLSCSSSRLLWWIGVYESIFDGKTSNCNAAKNVSFVIQLPFSQCKLIFVWFLLVMWSVSACTNYFKAWRTTFGLEPQSCWLGHKLQSYFVVLTLR